MQLAAPSALIRTADRNAIHKAGIPSMVLMERAALAVAQEILKDYGTCGRALVACGSGNNGGDGFAVARLLRQAGWQAEVFFAGNADHMSEDCASQASIYRNLGGRTIDHLTNTSYDLAVDALLGTGGHRKLEGIMLDTVRFLNSCGSDVLSVDVPTGIDSDNGQVLGEAVRANKTVSFSFLKKGLVLYPGAEYAGDVVVCPVGSEDSLPLSTDELFAGAPLPGGEKCAFTMDPADLAGMLPARIRRSHKGTYGRLLIAAGSPGMPGAAALCSMSAYKAGCGIVEVVSAPDIRDIILTRVPEAIFTGWETEDTLSHAAQSAAAAASGPGMGRTEHTSRIVRKLLTDFPGTIVLDADALSVPFLPDLLKKYADGRVIVTPHAGEMVKMTGKTPGDILSDPFETCVKFAAEHHVICVLKDAGTVVSDGSRSYINRTGCSGMSTAGSGDVLTGIIASLAAQGLSPFDAAAAGVCLHGLAGEAAAISHSSRAMTAADIADGIGCVFRSLEGQRSH